MLERLECLWNDHQWLATVWGDCVVVECGRCGYRVEAEFDGEQPYVDSYYARTLKGKPSKLKEKYRLELLKKAGG